MSIDGDGFQSIQYQNANNSVRVTDEFMRAVEDDDDWHLIARATGEPVGDPIPARELMREIARGGVALRRPGRPVRHDDQPLAHLPGSRAASTRRTRAREYMHVDDSACNLASLNLMKFRRPDGTLRRRARSSTRSTSCCSRRRSSSGPSSYPTEEIGVNARAFRQLGLGYANLGAYLMADGMPYDSDEGRATAAAITALMTGRAYAQSARVAAALGPYERYAENREPHNAVMRMHRDAALRDPRRRAAPTRALLDGRARARGTRRSTLGEAHGYRNAQATVLAPTGHDLVPDGLRHDGRRARLLARQVQGARRRRADDDRQPHGAAGARRRSATRDEQIEQIVAHINEHGTIVGAPGPARRAPAGVRRRRRRARDLAHGPHQDDGRGAAVHLGRDLEDGQPARRRRRSRTSPTPTSQAWQLGIKALAIYRDGSKTAQALRTDAQETRAHRTWRSTSRRRSPRRSPTARPAAAARCRASASRSRTSSRSAATRATSPPACTRTARVGEIFLTDIGKEGSTLRGMMNSFATAISIALQYGVPLETLVQKFSYMRFEPEGITQQPGDPVRQVDARLHHALARIALPRRRRPGGARHPHARGARPQGGRRRPASSLPPRTPPAPAAARRRQRPTAATAAARAPAPPSALTDSPPVVPARLQGLDLGPACSQCGGMMQRTGSCYTCSSCGNNTGCG